MQCAVIMFNLRLLIVLPIILVACPTFGAYRPATSLIAGAGACSEAFGSGRGASS